MPDYKKMYFQLAAKVTDAIEILSRAQQEGEAEFMEEEPTPGIKVIPIREEKCDPE